MTDSLNILLVEQKEANFEQLHTLLQQIYSEDVKVSWVQNDESALDVIDENADNYFDVCFVGVDDAPARGLCTIATITEKTGCNAPVIILTEVDDPEVNKAAVVAGATEYLDKNGLTGRELERAVRYAINKRLADEKVEHLAFHDWLTGLPNRLLLHDRLEQVLVRVRRRKGHAALMFLDLDNFKIINDSLGHSIGDLLLKEVSARLLTCCREEDTVARLGGDEFVILLPDSGQEESRTMGGARYVADKIFKALADPIIVGGNELYATASLGISVVNGESQSVDAVLRQAETAMYDAKSAGKDSYSFFAPQMEETLLRHVSLEKQLRVGLVKSEFYLHYQPINETQTTKLIGAEALVRWNNKELGQVSPGEFVPVAEASGLIWALGEKILEEACKFLVETPALPQLSVNISGEQIHRANFVPFVKKLIEETKVAPGRLVFELTETALLADMEKAAEAMGSLREFGVRFALDDFGTGYSSLSYLKKLPFDYVKIDGSFTRDMLDNTDDQAIIDAILSLGSVLGFRVTAEGVETKEQLKYLQDRGCDTVQGYFFSRPLSPVDFVKKWLPNA